MEIPEEVLKDLLEQAYRAGWDASGEGWNEEYPGDAHTRPSWLDSQQESIEELLRRASRRAQEPDKTVRPPGLSW